MVIQFELTLIIIFYKNYLLKELPTIKTNHRRHVAARENNVSFINKFVKNKSLINGQNMQQNSLCFVDNM